MKKNLGWLLTLAFLMPTPLLAETFAATTDVIDSGTITKSFNNTGICERDDLGDLHVVYAKNQKVRYAQRTIAGWNSVFIPHKTAGSIASKPTLAWLPDNTGTGIMGWIEIDSSGATTDYEIVTQWTANHGSTWNTPHCSIRLAIDNPLSQLTLDLFDGFPGDPPMAAACWKFTPPGALNPRVECSAWPVSGCPTGYWGNVSGGYGEDPSVAGRNGRIHVLWDNYGDPALPAGTTASVKYRKYDGAAWLPSLTVDTNGNDASITARPSDGHIYVAYQTKPPVGGGAKIKVQESTTGGASFTTPPSIIPVGGIVGDGWFPRVDTAIASPEVALSWEETTGPAMAPCTALPKTPGYAHVDDDFAVATPNGFPVGPMTSATCAGYESICVGNGFIDYIWTDLNSSELKHIEATYP